MLKRRIIELAVAAVSVTAAAGLTSLYATGASAATSQSTAAASTAHRAENAPQVTGAAPAQASSVPENALFADGAESATLYFLHAHAHNELVDLQSNPSDLQGWDLVRGMPVDNLSGTPQEAWEIQLQATGQCLNDVPSAANYVYLDSCSSSYNPDEYFWQTALGKGPGGGGEEYWFINAAASFNEGTYAYMTAEGLGNGVNVADIPAGSGELAIWDSTCASNC
jgi:hypothetical protein